jgi:hypothetical protein
MMTPFDRVPLPVWDRAAGGAETVRQIDAWLSSRPMSALVRAFGGNLQASSVSEYASMLNYFAASHWDFRQGRERDAAEPVHFDAELAELISSASAALGLVEADEPRKRSYDAILVLGGLVRGCIVRPRYAAQLLRGGLRVDEVVGLGAFRALSDGERAIAGRLGLQVADEFGAMTEGIRTEFAQWLPESSVVEGEEIPAHPALSWRVVRWSVSSGDDMGGAPRQVSVVAAPTSRESAKRANTIETYHFWAHQLAPSTVGSVLILTHPVYVPYQGCVAIQSLGLEHNLDIETIGISREAADLGDDTQVFGPQQFLQEIRSGIEAMTKLRSTLTGV